MSDDWKIIVLSRFCGEFPPAVPGAREKRMSSDDIAFALAGMGSFSADEVSAYMAVNGYCIEFDDGRPVWVLSDPDASRAITE